MTFGNGINERKLIAQLQERRRRAIDRAVDEPSQSQRDQLLNDIHECTNWIESLQASADWETSGTAAQAGADEQDRQAEETGARLAQLGQQLT